MTCQDPKSITCLILPATSVLLAEGIYVVWDMNAKITGLAMRKVFSPFNMDVPMNERTGRKVGYMPEHSDEVLKILKTIHGIIDDCVRETYQAEDEVPLSKLQSYFDILGSSYVYHSDSDIDASLLLRRISEWRGLTWWSQISILSGVYESALRELRYLLEDVLVTLIADKRNPAGSFGDRLKTVEELGVVGKRKRGFGLINLCRKENIIQNDEIKDILTEQYRKLCDFTHPSREIVERGIDFERKIRFSYDSERDNHAIELFMKSVECLLVVVCWQMNDRAQRAFANFFSIRISRKEDFIETKKVCQPLYNKWGKAVKEDLGRQLREMKGNTSSSR